MDIEPLREKLESFNWHVVTIDGHDIGAFLRAIKEAQATKGRPTFVIANTVKGKGVSFMEGVVDWHGVAPNAEQAARAIEELKRS